MISHHIIGIAGGSGSGKSTLAVALCKKYPNTCALLHLDDYFKKSVDAPKLDGFTNWEDPAALRLDDLYKDLLSLSSGQPITIQTKSELYHLAYNPQLKNKAERVINPKPIIIVEGYLAFHDPRIRNLCDFKIFLDIDIHESAKRRSSNKLPIDKGYFEKILIPFHEKFVEPTKQYANMIIDVSSKTADEVFSLAESELKQLGLIE